MGFSAFTRAFKGTGPILTGLGIGTGIEMAVNKESFGNGLMKSIPLTAAFAVLPASVMNIAMIAPPVIEGLTTLGVSANRTVRDNYAKNRTVGPKFTYQDTNQALTMRQAAVQAIQGSKLNARNALGGEASLMHRGYGGRKG